MLEYSERETLAFEETFARHPPRRRCPRVDASPQPSVSKTWSIKVCTMGACSKVSFSMYLGPHLEREATFESDLDIRDAQNVAGKTRQRPRAPRVCPLHLTQKDSVCVYRQAFVSEKKVDKFGLTTESRDFTKSAKEQDTHAKAFQNELSIPHTRERSRDPKVSQSHSGKNSNTEFRDRYWTPHSTTRSTNSAYSRRGALRSR